MPHLADRNDRNHHLRPTPAGVQAQPRRSRSRRLGERNSSGRRARDGGWERPERRRCWTGKALLQGLRFVVKHPLRKSQSRCWFALEILCKVERDLPSEVRPFLHVLQAFPQECQRQANGQNPSANGECPDLHSCGTPLLPNHLNGILVHQPLENDPRESQGEQDSQANPTSRSLSHQLHDLISLFSVVCHWFVLFMLCQVTR